MLNVVNRITALTTDTIIVPAVQTNLGAIFLTDPPRVCTNVFIYSPAGDGIYTDNTLPILIGGPQVGVGIGFPLLPGNSMSIDIGSLGAVFVFEPTLAGTQILVVTVSG